jgi:aryl-alcohol dehydrogenase-like predicted oxidoreductase
VIRLNRAEFLRLGVGLAVAAGLPRGAWGREPMTTRPIPASGEALPVVGLGTWQTFDVGDVAEERKPLAEVLRLLFDAGGTMIDSSPMYGRSEGVVGDLLHSAGTRDKAFLATKVWTEGHHQGILQMDESFRLLRTEKIDLMQIHNLVDWRTQLSTINVWKERGRVRYSGITHYTPGAFGRLISIIEAEKIDFVQLPYSIGVRDAEERLLSLCAEKGVAVLVNRPYEGGGLFRKIRGRELPEWAEEFDCASWGQFFLKYILGHPAVTCVIPGTAKTRHMLDNVEAGSGRPPDEKTRQRMVRLIEEL